MQSLAAELLTELRPFCERIEIAGSVRRGAPMCSDIELVAIPKVGVVRRPGEMFPRLDADLLDHYARRQLDARRWQPRRDKNGRPALGDRYKRLLVDGVALELFSVLPPASWGVVLLIRTGPAEFSKRMVSMRSQGGYLRNDCVVRNGAIWSGGVQIEIDSEREWFALNGMTFVPPGLR